MKIKFTQFSNIYNLLTKFLDEKLPIKLSYKLMKITSSLEKEVNFFQEKINDLILECAEKDENDQIVYTEDKENIKLQKDKIDYFHKEFEEINNMEIEIEDFNFTLDELENLELSPKELYILQDYIIE